MRLLLAGLSTLIFLMLSVTPGSAQQYKYQTQIAPGVAVPDEVETSIGTLHLHDGYPSAETMQKVYDNLDRSRALQPNTNRAV